MSHIIRVKKTNNYSIISNQPLTDCGLSYGARGLLAYLLTKPDDWEVRNSDLVNSSSDSPHKVKSYLKELQEAGYMRRYKSSDGYGAIGWITEVYEHPQPPLDENSIGDNQPSNKEVYEHPQPPLDENSIGDNQPSNKFDGRYIDRRNITHILNTESTNITTTTTNSIGDNQPSKNSDRALMEEIGELCQSHFSDPTKNSLFKQDLIATIKTYGPGRVLQAIQTALVDRANGKDKSWGYVKIILEGENHEQRQNNGSGKKGPRRNSHKTPTNGGGPAGAGSIVPESEIIRQNEFLERLSQPGQFRL